MDYSDYLNLTGGIMVFFAGLTADDAIPFRGVVAATVVANRPETDTLAWQILEALGGLEDDGSHQHDYPTDLVTLARWVAERIDWPLVTSRPGDLLPGERKAQWV